MTLSIGDHVIKVGKDGQPVNYDDEVYIEFEVTDLSPTYSELRPGETIDGNYAPEKYRTVQFAKLTKIK